MNETNEFYNSFLDEFFCDFNSIVEAHIGKKNNKAKLIDATKCLIATKNRGAKIILIGNGASAAIAEHMSVDLTKNAGLRAMTISGSPMMTAYANDYGYERMFQKGVEHYGCKGDVLIAISSSGSSKNILNACEEALKKNMTVITFSGFDQKNPLSALGSINFWINSKAYGYVEIIHNLLLHCINDMIVGRVEYIIR
ncbi:MAG: SIS domain-containing protein [Pseudomonadota bacterium]